MYLAGLAPHLQRLASPAVHTYRLRGCGQLEVHVGEGQGQQQAAVETASTPPTTAGGTATDTHAAAPDSTPSCGTDAAAEGSLAAQQPELHQKLHNGQFLMPMALMRSAFRHATSLPHPCTVYLVVNGERLGDGAVAAELLRLRRFNNHRLIGLGPALKGFDDVVMVRCTCRCKPSTAARAACHCLHV